MRQLVLDKFENMINEGHDVYDPDGKEYNMQSLDLLSDKDLLDVFEYNSFCG